MSHDTLYIVDNNNDKSVKSYLYEWCSISKQMDIATGYFEIGGLLELGEEWQKLDKIRIILGNEVTNRTQKVIEEVTNTMIERFRTSIEQEQEKNEFLVGVPAIINAMKSGKIECRIYDRNKFHAKAYITYFRDDCYNQFIPAMNIPSGYALVGSSNFTKAGLTQNIELNIQVKDEIEQLQEWFERYWQEGNDITEAVLKTMENHCREFSPYDVYLRSMYEYFKSHEETVSEWEENESVIYHGLSQYQKDGYNNLIKIAKRYSGAFLCDGVGLGKTYIGMMLIERFVKKERKNVVLIVPASARVSVWEVTIKKLIPEILEGFYPFKIINHTDLPLDKNKNLMNQIAEQAEIVIIDEAHHFRNCLSNRYKKLSEIMKTNSEKYKKQMFMLTATPINNGFIDLQHLIELFTHEQEDYFSSAPLGIHSLPGYFKTMIDSLKRDKSIDNSFSISEDIIRSDKLVTELVVQRSRAYVKRSLQTEKKDNNVQFPERKPPIVANYSLTESYGKLIKHFKDSFNRRDKNGRIINILSLAIYSPYDDYFIGNKSVNNMTIGRQQQIVNLIRILLLKRFESSIEAFKETCIKIYIRLNKFLNDYKEEVDSVSKRRVERKQTEQEDILRYAEEYAALNQTTIEDMEDCLPDYVWNTQEILDVNDFDINAMLIDTMMDMDTLSKFITDMMSFNSESDTKIQELKRILNEDIHIKNKKVIIFTEYRATAKYIERELKKSGFSGIYEIDGQTSKDRHEVIKRFAPYYNGYSSSKVSDEINILIATDVLAEGLNLQDALCLINYELHWNPVRLMQRIGRIDRRRDADIESHILTDHPEINEEDRKYAYYWNFLPPEELEQLLSLYEAVSRKTLCISKTLGIEEKKLLTPDDDYDALRELNSHYEGTASAEEEITLAYQQLLTDNPDYLKKVKELPRKMYSGKIASVRKGYFFCYELPTKRIDGTWSDGDGIYRWYFIDSETKQITEDMYEIWTTIKCEYNESRAFYDNKEQFEYIRKVIERYIKDGYLKAVQATQNQKAKLVTWIQMI